MSQEALYLVVDERTEFVNDVNMRMQLDDDYDFFVEAIKYTDINAMQEAISKKQYTAVLVSNTLFTQPDFQIPCNNLAVYTENQTEDVSHALNSNITVIGWARKSVTLFEFMEKGIDLKSTTKNNSDEQNEPEEQKEPEQKQQTTIKNDQLNEDTIFCCSCGSKMLKSAQFCPFCGAKNILLAATQSTANTLKVNDVPQDDINEQINKDLAIDKHKCKIITIYSAKGGVGKTTISCALATYLATTCTNRRKTKVCVVDYNIDFGNVAQILDCQASDTTMTIWNEDIKEKIENGENPEDIQYTQKEIEGYLEKVSFKETSDIYVLLAPKNHTESMFIDEHSLEIMLRNLKENGDFDYIICDTGNNTRDSTFIALMQADNVFMICTQDITTASCNDSFLDTMRSLDDFDSEKISLVINNIFSVKDVGISVQDIESHTPFKPFPCVARIRNNPKVIRANNSCKPLVLEKDNQFTKEVQKIVESFIDNELQLPQPQKKKGLFRRRKKE